MEALEVRLEQHRYLNTRQGKLVFGVLKHAGETKETDEPMSTPETADWLHSPHGNVAKKV